MKILILSALFCCLAVASSAQPAREMQLTIPVSFKPAGETNPVQDRVEISGTLLHFLDEFKRDNQILMSGKNNPVVRVERRGESTQFSFFFTNAGEVLLLEIMFLERTEKVALWQGKTLIADGNFRLKNGQYEINLQGSLTHLQAVKNIIRHLNRYLMTLHSKKIKTIAIKPVFLQDTLNVIAGEDNQFHTDDDHFWFDQPLYESFSQLGNETFTKLLKAGNPDQVLTENLPAEVPIRHVASRIPMSHFEIAGSLTTVFKAGKYKKYGFLNEGETYQVVIDYSFSGNPDGQGRFALEKLTIRNLETLDFAELNLFDFVHAGIPLVYIDLIKSVVQEEPGFWTVDQILQVIQDSFQVMLMVGCQTKR